MGRQALRFYPAGTQRKYIQSVRQRRCRAKDCVMKTVTTVQENAEDILAEAQQINEERAAQEAAAVQETEEDGADPSEEGTM